MKGAALRDMPLSEAEFGRIAAVVRDETGIALSAAKRPFVISRLARRVRKLGFGSFAEYLGLITTADGRAERQELISAITTNVTAFWREAHHFETLTQEVLPPLIARAKQGGRVRLWSAGCSTGQEAWTIAGIILQQFPQVLRHDLRVLATDIDRAALRQAVAGRYAPAAIAPLPQPLTETLFIGGTIAPAARQLVHFGQLNLLADWPMRGAFDVIFCRNVAIYFDRATQDALWTRFAAALAPGGWMMIGHSERLAGQAARDLAPAGITTYRKAKETP